MRPAQGPLAELSEEEFSEFLFHLGGMVWRTPATAAFARHKRPLNTVKDYLDIYPKDSPALKLAKEFWRDLAGRGNMTTNELCLKWYGKGEIYTAADVTSKRF